MLTVDNCADTRDSRPNNRQILKPLQALYSKTKLCTFESAEEPLFFEQLTNLWPAPDDKGFVKTRVESKLWGHLFFMNTAIDVQVPQCVFVVVKGYRFAVSCSFVIWSRQMSSAANAGTASWKFVGKHKQTTTYECCLLWTIFCAFAIAGRFDETSNILKTSSKLPWSKEGEYPLKALKIRPKSSAKETWKQNIESCDWSLESTQNEHCTTLQRRVSGWEGPKVDAQRERENKGTGREWEREWPSETREKTGRCSQRGKDSKRDNGSEREESGFATLTMSILKITSIRDPKVHLRSPLLHSFLFVQFVTQRKLTARPRARWRGSSCRRSAVFGGDWRGSMNVEKERKKDTK